MKNSFLALLTPSPWSARTRLEWMRSFSTLLSTGISLLKALALIPTIHPHHDINKVSMQLLAHIESGQTLAQSMKKLKKYFSYFDIYMVEAAEKTGTLSLTFKRLAAEHAKKIERKQKIQAAMAYPLFLLSLSVLTLWALSVWVIPSFVQQFTYQNKPLPALTQWVLQLGQVMHFLLPALITLIVIGVLLKKIAQKQAAVSFFIYRYFSRHLQWGAIARQALWCQTLALCLESGLPLLSALSLAALADPHLQRQQKNQIIINEVSQGSTLSLALKRSHLFCPLVWQLVDLWEASGGGPDLFYHMAQTLYQQEAQQWEKINKWSEPLLIMITGLMMGVMVMAMYLPMFQMGNML